MSLKVSIVGLQVKQVKNALQYLAKIGEVHFVLVCRSASVFDCYSCTSEHTLLRAGSELLVEALPEKARRILMSSFSTSG